MHAVEYGKFLTGIDALVKEGVLHPHIPQMLSHSATQLIQNFTPPLP